MRKYRGVLRLPAQLQEYLKIKLFNGETMSKEWKTIDDQNFC